MIKPLESILFATDLTPDCQAAYDYAVTLSIRFNATLYILYVMESMPENVEGRLKGLLGRHRWEDLRQVKEENVRRSLTGKVTSAQLLDNIKNFCNSVGVQDDACQFHSREIIISSGDVAETILDNARENESDLIVLGSRPGVLAKNHINDTIKTVLKEADVAVTVIPSRS